MQSQQTLHPLTFRNGIIVKTMILPSEACPPSGLFDAPLFFETVESGLVRVDGDKASEEIHERLIVGVGRGGDGTRDGRGRREVVLGKVGDRHVVGGGGEKDFKRRLEGT